ncbi:MAG TPA: STAS domain-containing protein [Acidimicrobiales bacterium]|jgi:anti-anti-sigma factor|nr:STAS domain-containing protein [Acidimicrobiales bacterium]
MGAVGARGRRIEPLSASMHVAGPVATIALSGELDRSSIGRFWRFLLPAHRPGIDRVVLDLDRLAFLDSAGLVEILRAAGDLRRLGAELVVARPTRSTRRLLEVTGVAGRLSIEPPLRSLDDVAPRAS